MLRSKESKSLVYFLWCIVITGIIISIINFIYNRSLWGDEAMLSLNISEKSIFQLLHPLEMNQVAPIGFLIIEKTIISIFGTHDWSLRILPFLSFLFSIFLLFKINKKLFNSTIITLSSCAIFISNTAVFYYSNEVKQYSTDILVALFLIFIALSNSGIKNKKEIIIVSLAGAFAIYFSNTSIIILVTLAAYLIHCNFKRIREGYRYIYVPIIIWMLSFLVYFVLFIKDHPSKDFMIKYWSARKAFPPGNIFSPEFRLFLVRKIKMLFSTFCELNNTWIFVLILFLTGIYFVYKKEKKILFFIIPVLLHFLLSMFKQYPFETRMLLYSIPVISIIISFGVFSIYKLIQKRVKINVGFIILIPLFISLMSLAFYCPVKKEEIKPCMQFVNEHNSTGEQIFVYYMANPSFQFYKKEYPNIVKTESIVIGNWHIHGCGKSFMSLQSFHNKSINYSDLVNNKGRFWLVFTGISESSYFKINGLSEDQYMLRLLSINGYQLLQEKLFHGASCYELSAKIN